MLQNLIPFFSHCKNIGSSVWQVAVTANKSAFFKKLLVKAIALAGEHVAGKQIPLAAIVPVVFANFPL
jgi:hypothetical protein